MSIYSSIVEDLKNGMFEIERTRLGSYGECTLYYEYSLYNNIIPDNLTLDDCNVYDEEKNKVPIDELPKNVRNEILKEFL